MKTRIVLITGLVLTLGAISHAAGTNPVVESAKNMASGFIPLAIAVGLFMARKSA